MAAKHHVNLKVVEEFLRRKIYPKEIAKDKGKKANFRRTCKNFSIKDGELFYKKSRKVILMNSRKLRLFMILTKESVKMQGQRPWPVIVVASQHIKS